MRAQDTSGIRTPEYWAWSNMRQRCNNPRFQQFADYGGRGITVCDRWNSFEAFFVDVGLRPSSLHSLDRKDNNGNYEPGNVRWATKKQQCRNTRRNRFVVIDGETLTVVEVAERYGLTIQLLRHRLRRYGSISAAIAGNKWDKHEIDGITATLHSHAKRKGLQPALVRMRVSRGWSIPRALTEPIHNRGQSSKP